MAKYLKVSINALREYSPCADSWRYINRTYSDTVYLHELLEKLIEEHGSETQPSVTALDWGFWALRLWTDDLAVQTNAHVLAKHILKHTTPYVGGGDLYAHISQPIALSLLDGAADENTFSKIPALKALYELSDVKPPVYFALGNDVGEFISDLALSALFYAGPDRTNLILHYEEVLLAFSKHDHDNLFRLES